MATVEEQLVQVQTQLAQVQADIEALREYVKPVVEGHAPFNLGMVTAPRLGSAHPWPEGASSPTDVKPIA